MHLHCQGSCRVCTATLKLAASHLTYNLEVIYLQSRRRTRHGDHLSCHDTCPGPAAWDGVQRVTHCRHTLAHANQLHHASSSTVRATQFNFEFCSCRIYNFVLQGPWPQAHRIMCGPGHDLGAQCLHWHLPSHENQPCTM